MSLSLWQPERLIELIAEVSVELQPLSLLLVQQEAVDVGEQLVRRHRGDEALAVQPQLVQQHHAEVEPGDSEDVSAEKRDAAIKGTVHRLILWCVIVNNK